MWYHDPRYGDFEFTDEDREEEATIQLWRSGADMPFTNTQVQALFDKLTEALKMKSLPTSKGTLRQAKASEFMLMHTDAQGRTGFKHSDTRNYLFLMPDGTLYVPQTKEPFMRGEFDLFE